ncbi:acyltransferase [Streptococcus sp. H31]|uniref:acyltransferase n=1 Tax=Streptococcus huangxiaojuni TaxID=3237239 RepID=UPI0034A47083
MKVKKLKSSSYNAGIDFLRIFAMLMIIITHILGKGGIRDEVQGDIDIYYWVTWLIQVTAYGAVNCYALISGYVGLRSPYRYSKGLSLWVQVFFYTFGLTLIFAAAGQKLSAADWLGAFFPVITGQYWYITAYFGLLVFMPLLNMSLLKLSDKDLRHLVFVAVFFFSVMPALFNTKVDEFSFAKGFSMNWLIVLYIIGAYLSRLDLKKLFKARRLILAYTLSILVTFTMKFLIGDIWYWYTSPSLLAGSVALFILCANLEIKDKGRFFSFIRRFAPTTLGVYLFHLNPLMVRFWMRDVFISFVDAPILLFPFLILATAVLIFAVSALVELFRLKVFKLLKIQKLAARLDQIFPFG